MTNEIAGKCEFPLAAKPRRSKSLLPFQGTSEIGMRKPGPHSACFIRVACLSADRDEHILGALRGAKKEGPAMDRNGNEPLSPSL